MRRSLLTVGFLLASASSLHAQAATQTSPPGAQPAGSDTAPKTGTAVIRGRVISGNAPLRRAQVRLSSAELRISRS